MYNEQTFHHLLDQEVTGNPSWVAFTADNLLYSVDENSDITGVAALDLNGEYYNPIAEQHGSSGVVHLEFNADATRMVGSAYGQGTIDVWDTTDGGLTLIKTIVSDGELGPGQESPHPHQALLDPTGRFFLVNDLGTNSILLIDTKDDAYEVVDNIPTQSGCGPRHAVFYPSFESELHYYILVCELLNVINLCSLEYTNDTIIPTLEQTMSTWATTHSRQLRRPPARLFSSQTRTCMCPAATQRRRQTTLRTFPSSEMTTITP